MLINVKTWLAEIAAIGFQPFDCRNPIASLMAVKARMPSARSNCVTCQGFQACKLTIRQGSLFLNMAFKIESNFRMQAVNATLVSFPLAISRS